MADVKTLHEIVTANRVYPADRIITDMPQTLIDELLPVGAVQLIPAVEEIAVVEEIKAAPAIPAATSKIAKKGE
ncbi:hypothetical protein RCCWILLIS_36 [Rhodobacter phage RcCWillis]|nr:hypothetical protein RCCWILLIS_36 [Rhodobacter phage RcCWillis]